MGLKQDWDGFDTKTKIAIGVMGGGVVIALAIGALRPSQPAANAPSTPPNAPAGAGTPPPGDDPMHVRLLPDTPRNQGLEVMKQEVDGVKSDLLDIKRALGIEVRTPGGGLQGAARVAPAAASTATAAAAASAPAQLPAPAGQAGGLDSPLPAHGGVDMSALGGTKPNTPANPVQKGPGTRDAGAPMGADQVPAIPPAPARRELKVWAEEAKVGASKPNTEVTVTIPVNSALEAFMLSGINARPSGAISAAIGSVNSATSVGAPFVTRIKGNAILPNGWKVADLGDCFLGASGTAVLSAERAYVIADKMSCLAADGEVWEGEVQAYGLDIDGTLGLAGKVVSKQGSLLAQAALTGMVSGLSSALSPQAVPAYNSSATGGSQSYQTPDPRMLAATAVGQGVGSAAAQLSKIYLDYAKELFPVVEVTAGTRVTWVLRASMELKRRPLGRAMPTAQN